MSTFRHPAFPNITTKVTDDRDDEALAAGWLPNEEAPQTPPPAVRTPSGLGKAPKGKRA